MRDRENSEERRAKIEQWNRERDQPDTVNNDDVSRDANDNHANGVDNGDDYYDNPQQ